MYRFLVGLSLAAATIWLAQPDLSTAQEKKDKEKPKRIAIADPKDVAEDPDFLTQGEYVGTVVLSSGEKKLGLQVVARGNGNFEARLLMGGLPGEGWDEKESPLKLKGKTEGGKTTLTDGTVKVEIANGQAKVTDGMKLEATLQKVIRKSPTLGMAPPKDAIVLFAEAKDAEKWNGGKIVKLSDGEFLGVNVRTKQKFKGYNLHFEFRLGWMPKSTGQGRSNSGLYIGDQYECQILDSFGLKGLNNECGGFYQQFAPKVNMCYPPLSWQTYDVDYTPAEFDSNGKKIKNAVITVKHNGVVIHDKVELKSETPGGGLKEADAKGGPAPIYMQDHGDPVVFRNIWLIEKK